MGRVPDRVVSHSGSHSGERVPDRVVRGLVDTIYIYAYVASVMRGDGGPMLIATL